MLQLSVSTDFVETSKTQRGDEKKIFYMESTQTQGDKRLKRALTTQAPFGCHILNTKSAKHYTLITISSLLLWL